MTISKTKQLENLELVFRVLLSELGDAAIFGTFFDPGSHPFRDVLATTWKELCDQGWMEERELYSKRTVWHGKEEIRRLWLLWLLCGNLRQCTTQEVEIEPFAEFVWHL